MLKKVFILLLLSISLCYVLTEAAEVAVVQSLRVKPYEEALNGLKSTCNCEFKRLIISEMEGVDIVKAVRDLRTDLIIAIGTEALLKVKKIRDIPIIYLMVPNPRMVIPEQDNITGVSMIVSLEKQMTLLREVVPVTKKVGLLYDPEKTEYFVKKARHSSKAMGIELITKEVHRPKDVPALVNGMKGSIDAFWVLPDTTVVTPETVEFLLLFSLENKIPILTFSHKYVEMGALMSIEADAFDSGNQAGEMVKKVLSGIDVHEIPRTDTRKGILSVNIITAKKLGITLNSEIINKARIVSK